MAVVLRDLAGFYSGAEPLPEPAQPFSEYARWVAAQQGTEAHERARRYWLDRLQGELPSLAFPTDRPHPPLKTYRADRHDHPLSPELVQALKRLGARASASFFTVLLTSFATFLHRLTGQEDVLASVPAAGQSASGMANVVGHCVNLLPIRCTMTRTASFHQCLQQRARACAGCLRPSAGHLWRTAAAPEVPPRPEPAADLVSVTFNLDQSIQGKDLPFTGLEVSYQSNPRHFENFELYINASETAGGVVLECQYNLDLFDAETVRDRLESFEALLAGAVAQSDEPIARLPLLSRRSRNDPRRLERHGDRLPAPAQTVPQLLHEQALRTPDCPALTFADTTLTYAELDARANQLAHHLIARGVGRGALVGLCMERSIEVVVGLLAILKVGAGYVPLDPKYPRERLGFMLADSRAALVLTQEKPALACFPAHGPQRSFMTASGRQPRLAR